MFNSRNLSHSSNFLFSTSIFGTETIYNIQNCNLPGISFSHINVSKSSTKGFVQADTPDYNQLNITIILDENMEIWKSIIKSIQTMREPYESIADDVKSNAWLEIHDDNSSTVVKLEFIDARIESISDVLYTTTDDDEILTVDVTIDYDFFVVI